MLELPELLLTDFRIVIQQEGVDDCASAVGFVCGLSDRLRHHFENGRGIENLFHARDSERGQWCCNRTGDSGTGKCVAEGLTQCVSLLVLLRLCFRGFSSGERFDLGEAAVECRVNSADAFVQRRVGAEPVESQGWKGVSKEHVTHLRRHVHR